MAQFSSAKLRFPPTLLERLFDDTAHLPSEANPLRRWGIDELKDSVARDLEVLLNSRAGLTEEDMALFPEIGRAHV